MRRLVLGLSVSLFAVSCTRPTLLVCESVTPAGVCERPTTTLEGGREYTLFAAGYGLPDGRVTIRIRGDRANGRAAAASSVVERPPRSNTLTNPVRLLYEGDYAISIVDAAGREFRSIRVHVTRPVIRPVPPWVR